MSVSTALLAASEGSNVLRLQLVDLIEGGLKRADTAQEEANRLLEEYREQLAQARAEAADIRAQAHADRAAMIEHAKAEAAAAAEQVTARANAQLEADRQHLRGE